MDMKKILALGTALAIASATPASAHGFGWGAFAAGAVVGAFARPFYAPPLVYAPPVYGYGYVPNPPVWYYPPGAPTNWTGYATPDNQTRWVQASLNVLGYGPLSVDGIVGFETYNAISAFEYSNHLVVDGV